MRATAWRAWAPSLCVAITGGSGAGKTSVAAAVTMRLGADRATVLPEDAYYRDHRTTTPSDARAAFNFDVPDAFDHTLFAEHLAALKAGQPVAVPVYCFARHARTLNCRLVRPAEFVIVEGLLVLWTPAVRRLVDLAVFLDVPRGLRDERRLARDVAERGRTADSVRRQLAATVHPSHDAYVEPARRHANLVVVNEVALEACADAVVAAILAHTRSGAFASMTGGSPV